MGNPQNKDQEIAAKEQELEVLKARKENIAEYPKMIPDPSDSTRRIIVNSKEEEARHQGTVVPAFDLTPEEQEAKQEAKVEADKEAAGAKSRLAGPESKAPEVKGKKAKPADKPGILARAAAKVKGKK